jgi:hypothetical protein
LEEKQMNEEPSTAITPGRRRRRRSIMVTGGVALTGLTATFALYGVTASAGSSASANPSRPIRVDQTDGYADGKVVVFTYGENYQCVHEPFDDRDGDGVPAAQDPGEFQKPVCEVGFGTKVGIDPAGEPATKTEDLFVIVPFFDADDDGEAAGGLAPTLSSIFGGLVPDAFDPTPGVPVQCPEPGGALSQQTGEFGTCTMHPSQIDYAQLLSEVRPDLFAGLANLDLPLVNHSHIIRGKNFKPVWWHLKVILVTDENAWPDVNGTKGIRSVADITAAQTAGKALPTINSNFFLFFSSRELHQH